MNEVVEVERQKGLGLRLVVSTRKSDMRLFFKKSKKSLHIELTAVFVACILSDQIKQNNSNTVDGRNPAPPGMYKTL